MGKLIDKELRYGETISRLSVDLIKTYNEMSELSFRELDKTEMTHAVLIRMRSYYNTQDKIKKFLKKRYIAAASDFFVESVIFYLRLYLKYHSCNDIEVHSERMITNKRNAMRPDISIWRDNKVIAIIECKTQLGWNRHHWREDFEEREKRLHAEYINAKAFLLVMTSENWGGFSDVSENVGKKYFCLSSLWPYDKNDYELLNSIENPIEQLFTYILADDV